MKFSTGIKIGAAVYLGWTLAEAIDNKLGDMVSKSKFYNRFYEKIRKTPEEPKKKERNYTIGFRMED